MADPPSTAAPVRRSFGLPGRRARVLVGLALALLAGLLLLPRVPAPPPSPAQLDTVVVDKVGLVSPEYAQQTSAWLHALQGLEAVLYIDAAAPDGALQAWTAQTAAAWGVGRSRADRGLVLFVFADAKLARVEVGYGLEGSLPDVWLRQALQSHLVPAFAKRQYEAGLEATLEALQQRIQSDSVAAPAAADARPAGAWSRTWADAWEWGPRLLPALLQTFRQSTTFERLVILGFALPLLFFITLGMVAGGVGLHMLVALPRRLRALRSHVQQRQRGSSQAAAPGPRRSGPAACLHGAGAGPCPLPPRRPPKR